LAAGDWLNCRDRGALIRDYVWLGLGPIAVIEGGVTSFVRTDHIGRPVFATNTAGVKVWTATYDPFGAVRTTTDTPIAARFPASGSTPNPACTRTGCGIMTQRQGATRAKPSICRRHLPHIDLETCHLPDLAVER
jgi:hypothetical protein